MGNKETLTKTIQAARKKLDAIDLRERTEEAKQYLGRFFKARNNYSCPQKPSDYWTMYFRVDSVKNGNVYCTSFQIDKDGHISINPNEYRYSHMMGNYTEISKTVFHNQLKKFTKNVLKTLETP